MNRLGIRMIVKSDGELSIVAPDADTQELLRTVDSNYSGNKHSSPLPGFTGPSIFATKLTGCGFGLHELNRARESDLWSCHDKLISRSSKSISTPEPNEAGLLDLKMELSRRLMNPCRLCSRKCLIYRQKGRAGRCGLGPDGFVAEYFTHVGEELSPSFGLNLVGCGLKCKFCRQWRLLNLPSGSAEPLDGALWENIDLGTARSLSFIGGSPISSTHAILEFLSRAPRDFSLPVVVNTHAYLPVETVNLFDGVADVYIPDFKFAGRSCARLLAGAPDYAFTALRSIRAMLHQGVPVIARVLVLPGHVDCCNLKSLELLRSISGEGQLFVSVRGDYCPDWKIGDSDGEMARFPLPGEIHRVVSHAESLGLNLTD